MADKRKGQIIAFFICVAISMFALIYFVVRPVKQMRVCSEKTTGCIYDVEVYSGSIKDSVDCANSDHNHTYKYVYSFSVNGNDYVGYDYSETQTNSFRHKVGESVVILYEKGNPQNFMVQLGIGDYLLMGIPVLFILFTLALCKAILKKK